MKNEMIDERQKLIGIQSLANAGIFMMICVIISGAYKIATTGVPGWEFWSMLGACVVMLVSRRLLGDVEQPKDIMNRPLPVGNSREDRNARKKNYAIQSAIFAFACAAMDIMLFAFGEHEYIDMEMTQYFFPSLSKVNVDPLYGCIQIFF